MLPLAVVHAALKVWTISLDAIEEYVLRAVKKASAEELNAWSLETFFDRTIQFVWVTAMIFTWAPFWLALPSLVSII